MLTRCVLVLVLAFFTGNAIGQILDTFNPRPNNAIRAIAVQTDGKIWVGGSFTSIAGQSRTGIARLNPDGTIDTSFAMSANGPVYSISIQLDGKVIVAGDFTTLGAQTRNRIARLNSDGTVDSGFNPNANSIVCSVVPQKDQKLLVAGGFSSIANTSSPWVARLNSDGTINSSFSRTSPFSGLPFAVAVLPDNKIMLGGWLYLGYPVTNYNLVRLNSDLTRDTSFTLQASSDVYCLAVQPDGKLLVGGAFDWLGSGPRGYIGRLNSDGTLDTSFTAGANADVTSIALQSDGKILVGGYFTTLSGQSRSGFGRLNADGTIDNSFLSLGIPGSIQSVAVESDGKILLGGLFTSIGGQSRTNLGRLTQPPATQTLSITNSVVIWMRTGSAPEISRALFDVSTNGVNWITLGEGTLTNGGWKLSGVSVSTNAPIRARGMVESGSSYYVKSSRWGNTQPNVLTDDRSFGISSNRFGFNVRGLEGEAVVLESSTTLTNWTSVRTNTLTTNSVYFNDPGPTNLDRRLYRIRVQ